MYAVMLVTEYGFVPVLDDEFNRYIMEFNTYEDAEAYIAGIDGIDARIISLESVNES